MCYITLEINYIIHTFTQCNMYVDSNKKCASYNQTLSEKRATSVSGYLANKGIASGRITIKGFGETAPKYDNESAASRTQNRRVEFLITANEKMKAAAEKEAGI